MNSFIALHLSLCCPTILIFYKGKINERIDNAFQSTLRMVCKVYKFFFRKSLRENHSLPIYHGDFQNFAKIFRAKNELPTEFITFEFCKKLSPNKKLLSNVKENLYDKNWYRNAFFCRS